MLFVRYYRCDCGAITLVTDDGREFSCLESRLEKYLPRKKLDAMCESGSFDGFWDGLWGFNVSSCNHCVNNYGIDLCACGSGEELDKCENGFDICGQPMQSLKLGYTAVSNDDEIGDPCEFEIDEDNSNDNPFVVGDKVRFNLMNINQKTEIFKILEDIGTNKVFTVTSIIDRDGRQAAVLDAEFEGYAFFPFELVAANGEQPEQKDNLTAAALWEAEVTAQQKSKKFLKDTLDFLLYRIRFVTMCGMKKCSDGEIAYYAVDSSELMSGNLNQSPVYYRHNKQVALVQQKLKKPAEETDMDSFKKNIIEMLENKSAIINKASYRLNPETLKVLKDFADNVWTN